MGLAELISLGVTVIGTIQKMQADGRASTSAEELAALQSAMAAADAADDQLQAIIPSSPS